MKHKSRLFLSLLLSIIIAVPAYAVFNEKDLPQTLSVLRGELSRDYTRMSAAKESLSARGSAQHMKMVRMMKSCNEISLILYSQRQDYTFDMAYALKEATKEYEEFNSHKMPFDDIVARLNLEIDRYSRLIESLRRLPPQIRNISDVPDSLLYHNDSVDFSINMRDLRKAEAEAKADSSIMKDAPGMRHRTFFLEGEARADRDSCLFYAKALLSMYSEAKDAIIEDNEHYEEASLRLKESYDFAQDRYKVLQHRIFIEGQDNYVDVLKSLKTYTTIAISDAKSKYSGTFDVSGTKLKSDWRGAVVLAFLVFMLLYIAFASVLSLAIVSILRRKIKRMQTEEFQRHAPCLTLFCGMIIFATTIMVGFRFIDNMFFIEASKLLLVFAWLSAAILLSLLVRLRGRQMPAGMRIYIPTMTLGLLVIIFRVIFIPNRLLNLIFPPILVLFLLWQFIACRRNSRKVPVADKVISWIGLAILATTAIMALSGYVLMALQVLIWWIFQLAAIETFITVRMLLGVYEKRYLLKRISAEGETMPFIPGMKKGRHISITWLFDLIKDALLPIAAILSFPLSIWLASDVFDLSAFCKTLFYDYFIDLSDPEGSQVLQISLYNIILLSSLYFAFHYIDYLVKSVYRKAKVASFAAKNGNVMLRANEINFTLANNIIGILVWGTYVISAIILVRIPMGAISIVAAGLATGIGLAMKDILNNFIYGIQLMSGRLRVGDYIECDGIRGKVSSISYQCTQIETIEGATMSFLNATLFSKNFMNLTRNNSYEFVKIIVGVGYGTDIETVRSILLEALKSIRSKDKYGRDIVDMSRGISVTFNNFADSAVELAVKQYVLVSQRNNYIAKAQEIIYNTLNENGIEIPFPQRDVNLRVVNKD